MSEKRDELLDAVDHACFQCIHMAKPILAKSNAKKQFGTPIRVFDQGPICKANAGHPAFGWTQSPKAKREIEAIESNWRMALRRVGHIVLD